MKMIRLHIAGVLVVTLLILIGGCSLAGRKDAVHEDAAAPPPPSAPGESAAPGEDGAAAPRMASDESGAGEADKTATTAGPTVAGVTRRIIKMGEMTVEVEGLSDALGKARGIADKAGGYVADLNVTEDSEGRRRGTVTVRVPAEKFDEVFKALQEIGLPLSFSESAQDVTEEWVDLEARISNKKEEEAALLALLKRKGELSDILEIQRETFRVRGEVEQLEGRLRYLKNQVSLSTISATLIEPGLAAVADQGPLRIVYHLRTAWYTLLRILELLVYFVIYVVIPGSVIWVPIVLLVRRARARARRRAAAEAASGSRVDGNA